MKGEAIIQYTITIACTTVLAFVTIFQAVFDLGSILLIFAVSAVLSLGSIYISYIREKLSQTIFITIALYAILFFYVLSKSPELSFSKFRIDTLLCTVIILSCYFCLFIFRVFWSGLRKSIDKINKINVTFSTSIVLVMALCIVYLIYWKFFNAAIS